MGVVRAVCQDDIEVPDELEKGHTVPECFAEVVEEEVESR
jgi:hypothetical protein